MPHPIRLHRFALSGHCHRVELMLSLLQLPCDLVDVNLPAAEHKAPPFLALNPFGQVPVIEDGDLVMADSNAILVYLAGSYDARRIWWPVDVRAQAAVQRWLSAAAGPLAAEPAAARVAQLLQRTSNPQAVAVARNLFGLMESQLTGRAWLAADHATIADVAMYSYTAHAPEGGIALDDWPQVRAWLQRVEALPGFIGMQRSALPAVA